jgi:uncharacterized membrane protein
MNNITKYFILFYVGFTTYISIETLFRGYSFLLMGIVGAICFLMFDKINEYIPWKMDLFLQGTIGSCIVTGFELIIGLLLQFLNLNPMWDYSMEWMNYKGVICPLFSFIWIWLAIIGIIVADCINYYLLWNGDRPVYQLLKFIKIKFPQRVCYYHCDNNK